MSDDFDEAVETPDFRLFFVNKECDECPMHLFDFESDEWEKTRLRPKYGDHVVKDGTEMFCMGHDRYRELGQNEEAVWDYSEPEVARIEEIQYHEYGFPDTRKSDPHVDPTSLIQHLNRW